VEIESVTSVAVITADGPASRALYIDALGLPLNQLDGDYFAWFTWATAMLNHRWTTVDEVPSDLPMPKWDWNGTEGW
jgi:hypothetical protein